MGATIEPGDAAPVERARSADRKPWTAALLGLLAPGLGHVYAGAAKPGIAGLAMSFVIVSPLLLLLATRLPRPLNVIGAFGGGLSLWLWGVLGGRRAAKAAPRPFVPMAYNRWWVYAGIWLAGAYLIVPLVGRVTKAFIGEAYRIPSPSMEPTIRVADFLWVAKSRRPPAFGTIVVYRSTEEVGLTVMKRALGLPGDTVRMEHGALFLNGRPVAEPYARVEGSGPSQDNAALAQMRAWQLRYYAGGDTSTYAPQAHDWGPLVVPAGHFFALGDNRDESYDSRYYGFVPLANVIGRPASIYFSYDPESYTPLPWLAAIRWQRIGLVPR